MRIVIAVGFVLLLTMADEVAAKSTVKRDEFDAKLYAAAQLHPVDRSYRGTAGLSQADQVNLLAARATLMAFLKSLFDSSRDPLKYVDESLRSRYPARDSLVGSEYDSEGLVRAQIYDYYIKDGGRSVQFKYTSTEGSEDQLCEINRSIALRKSGNTWKVAAFGVFDRPDSLGN